MSRYEAFLILLTALVCAFAFAVGSSSSERAHRALDQQYQRCLHRYGFGRPGFAVCLRDH